MATEVDFIIGRVASLLQDTDKVRWTSQSLTDYLNEAQTAIIKKIPASYLVTKIITLVAGTKQSLPSDGTILKDVTRNYDGSSPGVVIRLVDMEVLDATSPDWHSATAETTVEEYMYNPSNPYVFWVTPPQPAVPTEVEIEYGAVPPVVNISGVIGLGDEYLNAIVEYMLHRAYSRDAEYAGPEGRAALHLAQFTKELSGK